MPPRYTHGEKWVRLLRAYGPVGENGAQQAEHIDRLSASYDIPMIKFKHPREQALLDCFPESGACKNVVLTGTAGEGKTSLCFELVKRKTGEVPNGAEGVETVTLETAAGPKQITLIYDVTAWRKKVDGKLTAETLDVLGRMAESCYGDTDEFFVLAVNDGQMLELFRALPEPDDEMSEPEASALKSIHRLKSELTTLHAREEDDGEGRLRLLNLSKVPTKTLMGYAINELLRRSEWSCFEEEADHPLFSRASSFFRNYQVLKQPITQQRLLTLAKVADTAGHHIPLRGLLCLLSNALLGHPDAADRVLRPGRVAERLMTANTAHKAAFHRNLFGENLKPANRNKREVYRFLSKLHVGEETNNDLDELLIFGTRDEELQELHGNVVAPDPHCQRNPEFSRLLDKYIRGDIEGDEDLDEFLSEVASERRRLFLSVSDEHHHACRLWHTTVFHYAGEYIEHLLSPLHNRQPIGRAYIQQIVAGLNRVWTGLLLDDKPYELYLTTGLDLTTSPVSDILLHQVDLNAAPPGVEITDRRRSSIPDLTIRYGEKTFRFSLNLARFEFLCRVADGAMPSSFSSESYADFMSLKQRCLRELGLRPNMQTLNLIEVQQGGTIQRKPVHLLG